MSCQSVLDSYFKTNKVSSTPCSQKNIKKEDKDGAEKQTSNLIIDPERPCMSVKVDVDKVISEVIDLCSDDDVAEPPSFGNAEDTFGNNGGQDDETKVAVVDLSNDYQITIPPSSSIVDGMRLTIESPLLPFENIAFPPENNSGEESADSKGTIVYNPQKPQLTPLKRRFPQTPHTTGSSELISPQSGKKYFSPSKKRAVNKKISVRKDLNQQFANCHSSDNNESHKSNELLKNACEGFDDKTVFFITIVHKCISNSSLLQLLAEESQQLLTKCLDLLKPGMTLVCRLYWRKQGWYRLEKIKPILSGNNIDNPTLQAILDSLASSGFVVKAGTDGNILTFDDYSALLSADELKQICKDIKLKTSSKQDAIAKLTQFRRQKSICNLMTGNTNDNTIKVLKKMNQKTGPCYKLSDLARETIHELYILMYLGINYEIIREKKLELTLILDKTKQETYPVEEAVLDNASVVFRNRIEFERYVKAHITHEEYLAEKDLKVKCATVMQVFETFKHVGVEEVLRLKSLPPWLRRFTPLHLYIKILEPGVQDLKRESRYEVALEILDALIVQDMCRLHKRAEWYAEKALVLHKCERSDEAAKVLLEGFKANLSEESKDAMRPRAKLLAKMKRLDLDKKLKTELLDYANKENILEMNLRATHIYKQPMDRIQKQGKLKFETRVRGELVVQDVEEFCVTHFINSGDFTHGLHCEGRLITTIYFLLFWDIIYSKPADCPGVFLSRFQRYPLDLFCESFYESRKAAVEARLALVRRSSADELLRVMADTWAARPESEQSGLARAGLAWEPLAGAARCAGPRGLAALCARLARDFRYAHSGFPDLTLWNVQTQKIRFVEVKTDNDRPSMKQIQWMHYLQQNDLDVEFCYVGVKSTRCKARPVS